MTASTESDERPSDSPEMLPIGLPLTLLVGGLLVLAILVVVHIPMRTIREFLWGIGTGSVFAGLGPLVFPELRSWRPRTALPFTSRIRYACFILYLIVGTLILVYSPAAQSLGLWSLWK